MDTIKTQANKVSELVFSADTGATYRKTLVLTWKILRETGILLWLAVCLVFVGGEWFWKNSISLGRKARDWYDDLQTSSTADSKSATEMGQSAWTAISASTETLLYKAKRQLGIDADPPAPKPAAAKPSSPPPTPAEQPTPEPPKSVLETKTAVGAAAEETQADETLASPKANQPDTQN